MKVNKPDMILITDLAVMEIDKTKGRWEITKLMPGVTVEKVRENTGFIPGVAERVIAVEPPTEEDLRILRDEVDPKGVYLKRSHAGKKDAPRSDLGMKASPRL